MLGFEKQESKKASKHEETNVRPSVESRCLDGSWGRHIELERRLVVVHDACCSKMRELIRLTWIVHGRIRDQELKDDKLNAGEKVFFHLE